MTTMCDYSCGQEGKFQFKNGKWCCSKHHHQCPTRRKIISEVTRESMKKEDSISKKERIEKLRKKHKDPSFKQIFSESVKNGMNNIEVKEKLKRNAIKRETKEFRKCKSDNMKSKWKDESSVFNSKRYRENLSNGIKKSHNTENFKEQRGKQTKELWKNEIYRENHIKMMKTKWKDKKSKFNSEQRQMKISYYMKNGGSQKALKGIKKQSKQEFMLEDIIKQLNFNYERQYSILNYSVDVALVDYKIAIEYDGYYHFNCEESIIYHNKRQKEIEELGWRFLRYNYFNPFPTLDIIKRNIEDIINELS